MIDKPKSKHIWVYVAMVLASLLLGFILNSLFSDPVFKNPLDEIAFAQKTENPDLAEIIYLQELAKDSFDIDLNYGYVINHFDIPYKEKTGKYTYTYRNDAPLFDRYQQMTIASDTDICNLGNYMLGLIYLCQDDYANAREKLEQVKNTQLKYLNNSLANVYRQSDHQKALQFYTKEIKIDGNKSSAVFNLASLLLETENASALDSLIQNKELNQFLSLSQKRAIYYRTGNLGHYFSMLFSKFLFSCDRYGFIGALLITIIWLLYFRWLDIFEREKWYHILIMFTISSLFAYTSFLLYDLFNLSLHFNLDGNWLNDMLYCIFGIGFIEELVKILPFLIFISASKAANEPIDYIIYASVSAIGFSFVENLLYFQNGGYHMMHGRALSSVVAHMCDSSIVAYGFIIGRYKSNISLWKSVVICFLIATFVHGMYDFWLINHSVKNFSFITFLILLISVLIWNALKNNALNNSPFYDQNRKLEVEKISLYLFILLSGVFLYEYFAMTINYGPKVGNRLFFRSVTTGTFLLIFLTGRLAHFHVHKGVWKSIWNWKEKEE